MAAPPISGERNNSCHQDTDVPLLSIFTNIHVVNMTSIAGTIISKNGEISMFPLSFNFSNASTKFYIVFSNKNDINVNIIFFCAFQPMRMENFLLSVENSP